jgi:hypothetical protein
MAFDVSTLTNYTDELSFELVAKAVLTTDLIQEIAVRPNLRAGTVAINLMEDPTADATLVSDLDCGFTNVAGEVELTQVDITIRDKQIKQLLCPQDLRDKYTAELMTASAQQESVPFEEVIAQYYVDRIRKYNESFLINGDGTADGIEAQIKAGSTNIPAAAAAWDVANAIDQALDLYDAIDEAVKDRDDLIMVVSPANYRTLTRALVAQGDTGLFHYKSVEGNEILMLPGTNIKVVKSSGLVNSDFVFAGPAAFIVAGTGLEADGADVMSFFYDRGEDTVKFMSKWRLGVAVAQANLFAHNNL